MEALVFPSEESLLVALRSGLIPPELSRAPVRAGRTPDGALELVPSVAAPAKVKKGLLTAGVEARPPTTPLTSFACWAQVLPPVRVGEPVGALPPVLFAAVDSQSLLSLSGELLRLGCDRQELRLVSGCPASALVRVLEPPWFALSRALDHLGGLRAFLAVSGSDERVWVEVGVSHPLAASLATPDEGLVLITAEGAWWRLPDGAWTDVDALVVSGPLDARAREVPIDALPRITVHLSLTRTAHTEAPTLYVLPDGEKAVEALVRGLPEAQLDHLLFAVVKPGLVLLRARPGREANVGALPGTPYTRVLDLPNLFAPAGLTVEPPLRRDRLRTWLAPDADALTWLEPLPKGGFSQRSVPDEAFHPLWAWVDYVIDGAQEVLTAWARSATFDFEGFAVAEDLAPRAASPEAEDADVERPRPRRRTESRAAPAPEAAPRAPSAAPSVPPPRASATSTPPAVALELPGTPSELEQLVVREEVAFLELEAPSDAPARRQAWARLGELYARARRPRDAGMSWAHALWEAPADEVPALAVGWAESSGVRLDGALLLESPNVDQTRGVVARLLSAALQRDAAVMARASDWVAFLDRFDEDLDVRTFWLGRYALSLLAGGDALGLARARDRVLTRLQRGLSLDRDVPRLMRVSGQANAGGVGSERAFKVSAQLEALLKAFDDTPRKRTVIEAPAHLSRAYVHFEFAWAFARLGYAERARQLREGAIAALATKEAQTTESRAMHQFLQAAYSARLDQALEGVSPETPLPHEVSAQLQALGSDARYRADRLRQSSLVLEPQERLSAGEQYLARMAPTRGEDLAALRGQRDPLELLRAIESRAVVSGDVTLPEEERSRLLDGLMDFLPLLPESQALPLLQRLVQNADGMPPRLRAPVLEDALKVAGHFGRTALVRQFVMSLGGLIKELGSEGVTEIGQTLVAGVRSLRRVGLRDEAGELLGRAAVVLKGDDTNSLVARLSLAAGFAYLGNLAQAQPIIETALQRLSRESGTPIERSRLSRATSLALGHAPTDVALSGLLRLAQQLPWTTDHFSSNKNGGFCQSLIELADAIVMGHVGDDLTLNETTRRFLEEDEYLVRRRVHRDVGA